VAAATLQVCFEEGVTKASAGFVRISANPVAKTKRWEHRRGVNCNADIIIFVCR
jgi:hypothetical protein